MIFSSLPFLIFLPIVLLIVALLRNESQRRITIFAASLFFYGWWDWRFCFFLVGASTIDYWLALKIHSAAPGHKRRWLLLSVISNLGILATFKYLGWVLRNLNSLTGWDLPVIDVPLAARDFIFYISSDELHDDVYSRPIQSGATLV